MDEFLSRTFNDLFSRPAGPFHLRFILQPTVATFIAIRSGLKDAKAQRSAYLWTILSQPEKRRVLIRDTWKDIGKVFSIAFLLDVIYQIVVFRWIYPVQALIIAFTLAIVPYVLVRGPVTRIASHRNAQVLLTDAEPTQKTR